MYDIRWKWWKLFDPRQLTKPLTPTAFLKFRFLEIIVVVSSDRNVRIFIFLLLWGVGASDREQHNTQSETNQSSPSTLSLVLFGKGIPNANSRQTELNKNNEWIMKWYVISAQLAGKTAFQQSENQ